DHLHLLPAGLRADHLLERRHEPRLRHRHGQRQLQPLHGLHPLRRRQLLALYLLRPRRRPPGTGHPRTPPSASKDSPRQGGSPPPLHPPPPSSSRPPPPPDPPPLALHDALPLYDHLHLLPAGLRADHLLERRHEPRLRHRHGQRQLQPLHGLHPLRRRQLLAL